MMGFGSNGLMSVEKKVEQIWKEYIELIYDIKIDDF